jgi:hypothetical protein
MAAATLPARFAAGAFGLRIAAVRRAGSALRVDALGIDDIAS